MVRWMRLSTYIKIMTATRAIPINENFVFNFDMGKAWHQSVKANDLALKTATIVMFDRWSDSKNDQR